MTPKAVVSQTRFAPLELASIGPRISDFEASRLFVGLTDQSFTCTPASRTISDAARPLPRLTNALAEANCNGRDAVAPEMKQELQLRSI